MHQLTYISTAEKDFIDSDINAILKVSRRRNRPVGISGLLFGGGIRFLQALEGEETAVEAKFLRVKSDPRHRAAAMLILRENDRRDLGDWEIVRERVSARQSSKTGIETVESLVADRPDPNTRSAFTSFTRIDRSRAA